MTTGTTTLLSLALPVEGELDGTWGDVVNYGITDYVDIAVAGTLTLSGDGAVTLANTTGDSAGTNIGATTAQYAIIKIAGTLTATKVITAPSYSKTYIVDNTTATYGVTFKASGQTGVTVSAGEKCTVYYNGTDYVKVASSVADGVTSVTGTGNVNGITLTGTVTSTGNLTLGGTLANVNLTSQVTGTLPVLNGGTGTTTSTGSGNVVLSTSPTLVTPILGTPTSGNFSSGTFTWPTFNQNTSGTAAGLSATLVVGSGGTGTTTSTGTGNVVLSASPTFSGTPLAPTATTGTNTTQIATTAFVQNQIGAIASGVTSFSAGTTGLTPSTGTTGAVTLAGTLAVANGGTGTSSPALVQGSGVTITGTWPNQTIAATGSGGTITSVTGTAPVVSSGGTTPAISMAAATASVNGYMTSTYAAKLDGIAAGATNVTNTNQLTNGANFIVSGGALGTPSSGTLTNCTFPTLNQNTTGNAATATTATTATTANSTPLLQTTNFSISEVGGKLVFKYGATTIASMDSSGNLITIANVTAYGTP